jgi:hypothetical protein
LVDLASRRLQVFRTPHGGEYHERAMHEAGVIEVPGLSISVDVSGLFL